MRPTPLVTGTLAAVATTALVGLSAPASAHRPDGQPSATRERGALIECTGRAGATPVRVNLYQNRAYGTFLEVLLNDGTPDEAGRSVQARRPFLTGTKVRATTKVGGQRIVFRGTAAKTGRTRTVHEVVDDAGSRIETRGVHRLLKPRLTVTYGAESGRLSCGRAFRFDLRVTKTPTTD